MNQLKRTWQWMAGAGRRAGACCALASVVCMWGALPAAAEDHGPQVCDKDRLLSLAPPGVEAVVVINRGGHQRRSTAGRALAAMFDETGALSETRSAWRDLAETLRWTEEEAFDALLGRRLIVVLRGLGDAERLQWAVLSEVSAQTERRLREQLRPVPRGHVGGMLSHSVENGRYELVVGPAVLASNEERRMGAAAAMVLLGPGGGNRLLTDLAPMLLRPLPTPPSGPDGRECDIVLTMWQGGEPGGIVALTGTFEEDGWDLHLLASPGMVWGRPAGVDRIRPWSADEFRVIEEDALLAVMGVIGSAHLEGISALPGIAGMIPVLPLKLEGEAFGQRGALYVRKQGGVSGDATARAGEAQVDGMLPGRGRQEEGPSRLSVGMAIEAADTQRMLEEGDQMIARLLRAMESGTLEAPQSPRVQLVVAVPPDSVRVLRLNGSPVNAGLAQTLERVFGEEARVSWGVRPQGGGKADGPGWWVASISSGNAPTVERDAAALSQGGEGRLRPRLSMGVMRPAALEAAVHGLDPGFLVPLRAMRWMDLLRWDAWQREDGTVEATIRVRMRSDTH